MLVIGKFGNDTLFQFDAIVRYRELLDAFVEVDIDDETCQQHYLFARHNIVFHRSCLGWNHLVEKLCERKRIYLACLYVEITFQQKVLDECRQVAACKQTVRTLRVFEDGHRRKVLPYLITYFNNHTCYR